MRFGLTLERLAQSDSPVVIMHPGPINRGVEISSEVADSEHAIILDQVENGVAVRMAVLYLLAKERAESASLAVLYLAERFNMKFTTEHRDRVVIVTSTVEKLDALHAPDLKANWSSWASPAT